MLSRFTQEDEYRGDGLNLYAYCDNNPVIYWDPSGYKVCPKKYTALRNAGYKSKDAFEILKNPWGKFRKENKGKYSYPDLIKNYRDWKNGINKEIAENLKQSDKCIKVSGEFEINDWTGYPNELPKPKGPFRILEGDEYDQARNQADNINKKIHKNRPDLAGTQIHEMHPVKFGGSPTDIDNKIALSPKKHMKYTMFWNKKLREIKKGVK